MSKSGGPGRRRGRRLADECQERCGPGQLAGRWCYKGTQYSSLVLVCVKEKSKKTRESTLHTDIAPCCWTY